MVDYVLAPAEMPRVIQTYVSQKHNVVADAVENEKEEKARVAIINFIKEHFPHDFSDYKTSTILRRIKRRALANNMNSLDLYFNFLKTDNEEAKILSQDFLISVTSFFRDKEAFEFLETHVIPDIINHKSNNDELKIWVAGCATGEEAYSLAILIMKV
jgi:two-component system CheB/CheR fusion protein